MSVLPWYVFVTAGGKCGKPKKGHTCTVGGTTSKDTKTVAIQCIMDPLMTVEEMKKDKDWCFKDYLPAATSLPKRRTRNGGVTK